MNKFIYDDIMVIRKDASPDLRPGARAWVIAVFPDRKGRPGPAFDRFQDGVVYTVEYEEDAHAVDIHEDDLEDAGREQ